MVPAMQGGGGVRGKRRLLANFRGWSHCEGKRGERRSAEAKAKLRERSRRRKVDHLTSRFGYAAEMATWLVEVEEEEKEALCLMTGFCLASASRGGGAPLFP